jgi:large subunit ribosomal protein L9
MKVILKSDIEGLGDLGDVVEVKPGYARNYLLPTGRALIHNQHNINQMEVKKAKHQKKIELEKLSALEQKTKFEELSISILKKSGKNDILFGSVGVSDIVKELSLTGIEIENKKLKLAQPIKKLGDYIIPVKLFKGVIAELKVSVLSDNPEDKKDNIPEEENKKSAKVEDDEVIETVPEQTESQEESENISEE